MTDSATLAGTNVAHRRWHGDLHRVLGPPLAQHGRWWQAAARSPSPTGSVPNSNPVTLTNPGTYYWQAAYSGDATNAPSIEQARLRNRDRRPRARTARSVGTTGSTAAAGRASTNGPGSRFGDEETDRLTEECCSAKESPLPDSIIRAASGQVVSALTVGSASRSNGSSVPSGSGGVTVRPANI